MLPSGPSPGTGTANAGRTRRACGPPACSTSSRRCCSVARLPRTALGRWSSAAEAAWIAARSASCRACSSAPS
eukprot:14662203-Alexandrium_andersonii.AAC.2